MEILLGIGYLLAHGSSRIVDADFDASPSSGTVDQYEDYAKN
jgi:hypothetical protein